jgi:signal transduction histidine kinase
MDPIAEARPVRSGVPDADAIRALRVDAASRTARVLAHELANYFGSMRTMLYLLAEELGPDPGAREDLDVVVRTVDNGTRLVEALRRFAHAPSLGAGPSDLNTVLREAEPAMRTALPPGRALAIDLWHGPLPVLCDAAQLRQLGLDLVAGARRAPSGGGRIRVETGPAPDLPDGRPAALLAVHDDAPGLEPEAAARIFEPYVFDDGHDAGLRLPTIYASVVRSGGAIGADSTPDGGTTIRVSLPLAPARAQAAAR